MILDRRAAPAVLLVDDGSNGARRVEIVDSVTVGRGETAGLVVDDAETSRMHAVFRHVGERLEIQDLGSLNGTWVNGQRIDGPTVLSAGDRVKVGATRIDVLDAPQPRHVVPEDELRPVTALFADVVGSTALAERLPPDELKALMGGCVDRMCRAVERFGGVIDAYMGDGIAAFFGFPVAKEDDAERAARAALSIVDVISRYATEARRKWELPDLRVRVGINSGQIVIGVVGVADRHPVAVGDAMNVAARLQAAAEPGTILIGGVTAKKLRGRFLFAPIGRIAVRGREAPVEAWRLLGIRPAAPLSASHTLVGRTAELERLSAAAETVAAGRGQILLLTGEPGIGKSRLLDSLREQVETSATWLDGHCTAYGDPPPYAPFVDALRAWLASQGDERPTPQTLGVGSDTLPYLAALLSVPVAPEKKRGSDAPDDFGAELRRAYCRWIRSLSERAPVVLALHDVHAADRYTHELAEQLLELTGELPLTIAVTSRAEAPALGSRWERAFAEHRERAVELRLGPLSDAEAEELLTQLVPGELADDARRELLVRAEGNPLYLEHLLRSLLETGGLAARRTWSLTISADRLPTGLESLLIARIDALPPKARRLAQLAAVVGRTFSLELLDAVEEPDDAASDLAPLLRADIVRAVEFSPHGEYEFTHGLLQDAALSTLSRARRRELYEAVARAYEKALGGATEDQLERLAFYHGRGGDLPKALNYLERAAARASKLRANTQSAELWARAAAIAEKVDDTEAQRRIREQQLELGDRR